MGFFKRQLLKVIKWEDNTKNQMVYKYPMEDRDEIMNGCELIVAESQVALLVSQGQIGDVYGPGSHKLTTGNMPVLTKLASWKYGFDSPFKADVYYVNTKQFTNQKWGTSSKIVMRDADFGAVRIGARGTYSFKVSDAAQFMREIFGTNKSYKTEDLIEYFRSIVVSNFAKVIGECKIPVLDLQAKYVELGENLRKEIMDDFAGIGLDIVAVYVESIVVPEEVEKAMDKRATVGVMSDKLDEYTKLQTAEAIRDAASNPSGGMANAGIGFGVGIQMAKTMSEAMQNSSLPKQDSQTMNGGTCAKCGNQVPVNAKFCPNCGSPIAQKRFCTNCGNQISADAKFCPNCGHQA